MLDRGYGGGLAGSDPTQSHTGRRVDVVGIDDHEITQIPIVTAGGVMQTSIGSCGIMPVCWPHHPRWHYPSGQLEHYRDIC
jgi:hypothetical protein